RDGDPSCSQVSLFRLTVRGVVVLRGMEFESFKPLRRNRNHGKVSISNTGPFDRTGNRHAIGAILIFVDSTGLMTLDLVALGNNRFGSYRIEGIFFDSLVTDTWSHPYFRLRHHLFAALDGYLHVDDIIVGIKHHHLGNIQPGCRIRQDKLEPSFLTGL